MQWQVTLLLANNRTRHSRPLLRARKNEDCVIGRGLRCRRRIELHMLRFGDPEAAARVYEQALDLAPESEAGLAGLAQIAQSSGDDEAIIRA